MRKPFFERLKSSLEEAIREEKKVFKQIQINEVNNKTIERHAKTCDGNYFVFTDGTFLFERVVVDNDDYSSIEYGNWNLEYNFYSAFEAGIVTPEEYDAHIKEKQEKNYKDVQETRKRMYLELKKEFES